MPAEKIRTTADLRKMLIESIESVRSGELDPQRAQAIATLSTKVLQSAKLDLDVLKYNLTNQGVEEAGKKVLQLVAI